MTWCLKHKLQVHIPTIIGEVAYSVVPVQHCFVIHFLYALLPHLGILILPKYHAHNEVYEEFRHSSKQLVVHQLCRFQS